ncbi:MAG: hypothetical protein ACKO5K_04500 [Armatimonadota bacterium]
MKTTLPAALAALVVAAAAHAQTGVPGPTPPQSTEMAGYLIVPHDKVASTYDGGFSMYVAAWPLLETYPGQSFQSGLFGTWMFPKTEGKRPKDFYTDIEGGLGWWRDTRFATETPKFIMGGVALNFSEWANGPGAGKGRDWSNPTGLYAVAQLSPRLLWPPDGLNLRQGTRGELFGYGYLPLPLTDPKPTTNGAPVPTGNQCWTLFVNSANFKGPVAFFTPHYWARAAVANPELAGMFLDTRPSEPNKAVQMETQHIPALVARDRTGTAYARIAATRFPGGGRVSPPLIHRITAYTRGALWDAVEQMFKGGPAASGRIDPREAAVHAFKDGGYATWRIQLPGVRYADSPEVDLASIAAPAVLDRETYGFRWSTGGPAGATFSRGLATLPTYYRLSTDAKGKPRWVATPPETVPAETGLATARFPEPERTTEPYVTPGMDDPSWGRPGAAAGPAQRGVRDGKSGSAYSNGGGPAAGPFKRVLGDGSEVEYVWYRFSDQPALRNAGLTEEERTRLQRRVEWIHRDWPVDRDYLPPPATGRLAGLDSALLVTPPKGLEVGYVPIVTRQGWAKGRGPRK